MKRWSAEDRNAAIAILVGLLIVCFTGYSVFIAHHTFKAIDMNIDMTKLNLEVIQLRLKARVALADNNDWAQYEYLSAQANLLLQQHDVLEAKYEKYDQWLNSVDIFH